MEGRTFEIKEGFYLDGVPFRIISGGIHYFRVVPEYWQDRLEKLKAMGCNTVETYVPWNLHEPKEGCFDFTKGLDLARFIRMAQDLGLYVIVRPSPYICAEWEFGGLPAWLLAKEGLRVRSRQGQFLSCVRAYYKELFQILTPLQITKGGPIILMQIENEYGYYGDDTAYLQALQQMMEEEGVEVPFVTSDGPMEHTLRKGSVPSVLATGNFGSRTKERFAALKRVIGEKPLMCMEFWVGWFDAWGNEKHSTSNLEENKKDLEDLLQLGNLNFYMFHGGTNFGFMNGSNYYDRLTPDVTSYDYDAILTEDGQITEKYKEFQKTIRKYAPVPEVKLTTDIRRKDYGRLEAEAEVSLFSTLAAISTPQESLLPQTMEQLGQNYGYILYRSQVKNSHLIEKVRLVGANDRALLFVNGEQKAVRYDRELLEEFSMDFGKEASEGTVQLDILMENMGRVNFGEKMQHQKKGIADAVLFDAAIHSGWEQYCLPLDNIEKVDFAGDAIEGTPSFFAFSLEIDETADTFVDMSGWGKGCVFVNGVNIGRFWEAGPQKRLYLPAPLLKQGTNRIVVFETDGKSSRSIALCGEPDLG
ncbi:MAG: beta-galactosidase [bacterium]|nr:beta-galactosidase [bacterium]